VREPPQAFRDPRCPHFSYTVTGKIEVSKGRVLPEHLGKPCCPVVLDVVLRKIKVSNAWPEYDRNARRPFCSDSVQTKVQVNKGCTSPERLRKPSRTVHSDTVSRQIEMSKRCTMTRCPVQFGTTPFVAVSRKMSV
jgi:hypothetical protein